MAVAITRFSRFGVNLGRIKPLEAKHIEGTDGTDELTVTCYEDLNKGEYLVWRDHQGIWHEHIVDEPRRDHDERGKPITLASCINSINETWDDWLLDVRPTGTAQTALESIMANTRWGVGTCTQEGSNSHTYYHKSVREGIQETLETWGGELLTTIQCDGTKVTGRLVSIVAARGDQLSSKRFTWTKDLVTLSRTVGSTNPKTRIYAYGKGEEIEETGGYGRRIGIDDVNAGIPYVEDATLHEVWGHEGPDGTVLPAVGTYLNDQCDDPAQLLAEATAYLEKAKQPEVTYRADVIDLAQFGRSWEEVALGDRVAIIDKEFSDSGVRLTGRITRLERDLLTYDTGVTFGTLTDALAGPWAEMQAKIAALYERANNWDQTASPSLSWLDLLIQSLNAQYDAAGTYHYSSFEQGEIWSNVPLDENGYATQSGGWAMNINGMGFRLASSLNADGSWNWRAFGTGLGFTADEIIAGMLHSAGYESWLNLETGECHFSSTSTLGDANTTVATALGNIDAASSTANSAALAAVDAATAADDAATKATHFITSDPSTGITIGDMVGGVTQRAVRLSPTSLDFLDDGVAIATFGESIALGVLSDYHMQITSSAISFFEAAKRRAYLSGDKLNVVNAEAEDAFFIGDYSIRTDLAGYFAISKRA